MKILLTFPLFFVLVAAQCQQKVAFTAYFSNGGDIDIGQSNPIIFNKVTVNVGNGYDTSTGIFTAPVSGVYLFILSAKASERTTGVVQLGIHKSGSVVMQSDVLGINRVLMDQTASFVTLQVRAGETVDVRRINGPTILDKWYETSFTGILLYAD